MLPPRSRIRTDAAGQTWLEPDRVGVSLAHGLLSVVVSVLIIAGAAAATLPPTIVAVPALAGVIGLGAAAVWRVVRATSARVCVGPLGVTVVGPTDAEELSWASIRAVTGAAAGRRTRIRVDASGGAVSPSGSFSTAAARAWLEVCAETAAARRLGPVAAPDGLGFVAGDVAGPGAPLEA